MDNLVDVNTVHLSLITYDRNNTTPLFLAAAEGNLRAVQLLIAHGASVQGSDDKSRSIIQAARSSGNRNVIKLIEALLKELKVREERALEAQVCVVPISVGAVADMSD